MANIKSKERLTMIKLIQSTLVLIVLLFSCAEKQTQDSIITESTKGTRGSVHPSVYAPVRSYVESTKISSARPYVERTKILLIPLKSNGFHESYYDGSCGKIVTIGHNCKKTWHPISDYIHTVFGSSVVSYEQDCWNGYIRISVCVKDY